MVAESPALAIGRELARLPVPDIDPEPIGLFTRHLPHHRTASTIDIERDSIRADYVRLLARLNEAVERFKVHFAFHTLEALCVAGIDPVKARPYVADVGHACVTIEALIAPETSAIDQRCTRVWR